MVSCSWQQQQQQQPLLCNWPQVINKRIVIAEDRTCSSRNTLADRLTIEHRHTDKRHANHNTPPPITGGGEWNNQRAGMGLAWRRHAGARWSTLRAGRSRDAEHPRPPPHGSPAPSYLYASRTSAAESATTVPVHRDPDSFTPGLKVTRSFATADGPRDAPSVDILSTTCRTAVVSLLKNFH